MNIMQDMASIADDVGRLLKQKNQMLVTAESCTGGLIGAVCTDIPGSSSWFYGGIISYANEAKQQGLGVQKETISSFGAVSENTVAEMCEGALRFGGSISVAVSGVAGPAGGSPEKPVGCVYIGWKVMGEKAKVSRYQFSGDREAIRKAAVLAALEGVIDILK